MKILLLVILLVFAATAFGCRDTPDNQPNASIQYTPRNVRVESDATVDAERLVVIDQALTELFADAAARNYSQRLAHGDYAIFVNRQCVDRNGTMAWLARADNYDGSEYDQDPRPGVGMVYRAEEVVKINNQPVPRYIICFDSPENMARTARYGAEHIILAANDYGEYLRTETHTGGAGHPIIPGAQ